MNNLALKVQDDSHLPEEFLTVRYRSGEQRLMQAILADATEIYRAGPVGDRRLFAETVAWFLDDTDPSLFAFRRVCDALRLDPAFVRARLGLPSEEMRPRPALRCVVAR